MIELFRENVSTEADWVEAELREMVVGYERIVTTPVEFAQRFGAPGLPVLRDGERMASGREELMQFLRDLEFFAAQWRMFEGDWCYVDEDGETC
jgi:hypothetical protein